MEWFIAALAIIVILVAAGRLIPRPGSGIDRHGFEVVILDPLYRAQAGMDNRQLAEAGEAVAEFAEGAEILGFKRVAVG